MGNPVQEQILIRNHAAGVTDGQTDGRKDLENEMVSIAFRQKKKLGFTNSWIHGDPI